MKLKLASLKLLGFIVSLAPLGIYVGINFEQYAPTTVETVKLGVGGAMVAVMFLLKALKKMKMPGDITFWAIALAMAWLMQAVLADFVMLASMMLSGSVADEMVIQHYVIKTERAIEKEETTDIVSKAVVKAIGISQSSGRV